MVSANTRSHCAGYLGVQVIGSTASRHWGTLDPSSSEHPVSEAAKATTVANAGASGVPDNTREASRAPRERPVSSPTVRQPDSDRLALDGAGAVHSCTMARTSRTLDHRRVLLGRSVAGCGAALALASVVVPSSADAANGLRPRTPATFADTPCMLSIDKGEQTSFLIEYGVPYDDTELTPDELPDSRQMQFFAIAKQSWDYALPIWINQSDYDRALDNGDITREFTDEDIFDHNTAWAADEWVRITPDDARLPITAEQAAMGVTWDLTEVPVGTWMVAVYTWEPENNLWSYRFGAIRIIENGNEDAAGPSAFLPFDAPNLAVGDAYPVSACMVAPEGSTYTASYGVIQGVDEPQWVPFVEDAPVLDAELELDFEAPAEAAGLQVKIRLDVTDPDGRSYTAYSPAPMQIIPGSGGEGGTGGTGGSTGATAAGEDEDGGGGRGCAVTGQRRVQSAWLPLLAVFAIRRRRLAS